MKKFLGFIFLVSVTVFILRAQLLGLALDPLIEKHLTRLFAMPIQVEGLRVDPLTGDLWLDRFEFRNQPEFSPQAHIDIQGLRTRFDVRRLFQKQVLIEQISIQKLDYYIERIINQGKAVNNAKQMARAVKKFRKELRERRQKELEAQGLKEDPKARSSWFVHISEIHFDDGSFHYYSEIDGSVGSDFTFHHLTGLLTDVRYPNDAQLMNQVVKVRGLFGRQRPVPFWAGGKANFINSLISFNLKGHITEGPVKEYERLFDGMQVEKGSFVLDIEAVCKLDYLKAQNKITMKSLRLTYPGVAEKIWGLPKIAALKFLETEKNITLNLPLEGVISDPVFDYPTAFREAFQNALRHHTVSGLSLITEGPVKLAAGTQDIAVAASEKIVGGVGQVTVQVTDAVKQQAEAITKVWPQPQSTAEPIQQPLQTAQQSVSS